MSIRRLHTPGASRIKRALVTLASLALLACGSSDSDSDADIDDDDDEDPFASGMCFPDADGLTDDPIQIELTVTDTGFSKKVLTSQDNSRITLTLKNDGSKPHGFRVGCASVLEAYPNVPDRCPKVTCFPGSIAEGDDGDSVADDDAEMPASIEPIEPGDSKTIMFITPTTDNVIYPFTSNSPDDESVEDLNNGQWTIM
jgi:hypothetical protein